MTIKKRDIGFFILGLFTFFVIETVMNWSEIKDNMIQSGEDEIEKIKIEQGA